MMPCSAISGPAAGVVLALLALAAAGCASRPRAGPYTAADPGARDPGRAEALSREAAGVMSRQPQRAEHLLREALTLDLFCGPAHNNLGVLYLDRGQLYEAASEFEWARKLMPGHANPRLNLAIVLDRGGRTDEAAREYRAALDVHPGHIATLQALSRHIIRYGSDDDDQLHAYLHEVAVRGETEHWRTWATDQLARTPRPSGE